MSSLEESIIRKGLELGFSNVGFTTARNYPEYLDEVTSRHDYDFFSAADDSLLTRLSRMKDNFPWAQSVVCATIGFSNIAYPKNLLRSVARTYLARVYSPLEGTLHAFQITALADYLEELGMKVERNQFCMPQRLACAEAGIITFGNNNFAYTEQDGSFVILVTFLVDAKLEPSGHGEMNGCPDDCTRCIDACPTGAIEKKCRLNLERCILFNNQRFEPGAQREIWDKMGLRIHGCDVCQEVCPRNRDHLSKAVVDDGFLDLLSEEFDLEKVLELDKDYYDKVVHPIMYNYIKDMDIFRRNAAVALGNTGDPSHVPALESALENTDNPHLIEAIQWAIDRLA